MGKVKLIMAVHVGAIVISGTNGTCRGFHAALVRKFPTNSLGERNWRIGCAFKRYWGLGTLEVTQKPSNESIPEGFWS